MIKLQKLPEVVDYLYKFQSELGFVHMHLALPREENKHLYIEKTKPGGKLTFAQNQVIENRVFTEQIKISIELPDGSIWVAVPMFTKGKLLGAIILSFNQVAPIAETTAWLEQHSEGLALAVEHTLHCEILEKQLREKSMQLVVMNALTSEKDYGQMFLTITAAINNMINCDLLTIPAFSPKTGFVLSGYNAMRQNGGFTLISREEMLEMLGLDLETYRQSAFSQLEIYSRPHIFTAEEYSELSRKLIVSNRFATVMGVKEALFVPIALPNDAFATLIVCSKKENSFFSKDLRILIELAKQITHQIGRLLTFEQKEVLEIKLRRENTLLIQELNQEQAFSEIIGRSPAIKKVLENVHRVAPTDSTVLLQGETGTGKELIARAIHNMSNRKNRPLIKVNCAALPAQLIESELFGHEKGAFTGATERRIGKFELANGGTIFLDEIGELPLELQSKLLRVLQEYEIERVGGKQTIQLDIRVIAATNRNLYQEAILDKFRMDLYYRISTFPFVLPPLRERREDIPLLVRSFIEKYSRKIGKGIEGVTPQMMDFLLHHSWPGNIRELEHVIEQAVILASGPQLDIVPAFTASASMATQKDIPRSLPVYLPQESANLTEIEDGFLESQRQHILKILEETGGRIRGRFGAAQRLGLKPTTLEARMKKLGIRKNFSSE
ncbi:sigma 54-interacting transcriptional regulator [Cytophagaceae bacterium DM2B3-1]|uniref:Sigma 54-interacting transcriptional regulator n=1 Tax=Xanthocytophaga flava TaxID=3048013 RepID=A0ABT7CSZ7_9BACT|nr:sigma 54-interacting transcriptional regulator [Xanthocytophaga flavus]MDJ1471524.1 sigma 54-interacting transcriptional regulator [Xanthocytophaga flavus]MDJ1496626.1 sigma 54-interacting transcriptional regulator [Xanthocytophaga flavus]